MTPAELRYAFEPLMSHLNTIGTAVLTVQVNETRQSQGIYSLLEFKSTGNIESGWPIVGSCDLRMAFDTSAGKWEVSGHLFGQPFSGNDPRSAASKVVSDLLLLRAGVSSILERSHWCLSHYGWDINQFAYQLRSAISAIASVEQTPYGCRVTSLMSDVSVDFYATKGVVTHFAFVGTDADKRLSTDSAVLFSIRTKMAGLINTATGFIMRLITLVPEPDSAPPTKVVITK